MVLQLSNRKKTTRNGSATNINRKDLDLVPKAPKFSVSQTKQSGQRMFDMHARQKMKIETLRRQENAKVLAEMKAVPTICDKSRKMSMKQNRDKVRESSD